jgi:hypothetical protein
MGAIKTTELSNGNIGLEITYGGKEAPFGGVDTSAPPAYIDPTCFTQCDGFIVVDNKLVAASLNPVAVPTLWGGSAGVILIGFGNFYNTTYGTLNYALGYGTTSIPAAGNSPSGVTYTFYMTSWNPENITQFWNDTLTNTLYNSVGTGTFATLTMNLDASSSGTAGSGASINITAITSVSGPARVGDFNFILPGIVSGVSINAGGINYVVGETFWLVQGSNATAQVTVSSVSAGSGAITGLAIVSNSFNTTYIDGTNHAAVLSTAGWGYSVATATLVTTSASNVVLNIAGPFGTNTYTVITNGSSNVTPAYTGSGAAFSVTGVYQGGTFINLITQEPRIAFSDVAIANISLETASETAGTNYNVGEVYMLASAHTTTTGLGWAFDDVNTFAKDSSGNSTVWVEITAVGAGGSITGVQLVSTGLETSNLSVPLIAIFYLAGIIGPAPINTVATTPLIVLDAMASAINSGGADSASGSADQNVTAAVNVSASSLTLTSIKSGSTGNTITAWDTSVITGGSPSYYYFSARALPPSATHLTGGSDTGGSGNQLITVLPSQASIASVGGTLYIGNVGSMIIKYGGPGSFATSTTLQGVRVLRKFAGSLIGLGKIDPPNVQDTAQDMMFLWSAANDLDTWSSLGLDGNVSGAGFTQLADIGDYLTGLIVTNATAFIIRSQGLSYATATSNATSPFNYNHIGLGDEGEGSQIASLVCQYDQTGAFAGNSDLYQISGTLSSIGQKIKALFFSALNTDTTGLLSADTCAVFVGQNVPIIACFQVGSTLYVYNFSNKAWTSLAFPILVRQHLIVFKMVSTILGVFALKNVRSSSEKYGSSLMIQAAQWQPSGSLLAPVFQSLIDGVPNSTSTNSNAPTVTFPVEEVSFGRDITIDGLYISLMGNVTETTTLNFNFNGIAFGSLVLAAGSLNMTTPTEFQVFPSSVTTSGAFTVHSPQLSVTVPQYLDAGVSQLYIVKIAEFGSFDPKQRPV